MAPNLSFRLFVIAMMVFPGWGGVATAQELLTPKERETVLERLAKLDGDAGKVKTGRFNAAVSAYRTAMATNEAVMDLYLQCLEKVRYEEQNRPLSEFREWKRANKEHLGEAAFRDALRHQVRWLLLGLEMAGKELAPSDMSDKAAMALADIARDARPLAPHAAILRENAFQSVFAQAYKIGHFAPEKWPGSPLPIGPVYQDVILPPLRTGRDLKRLEAAWNARLDQETLQVTMEAEKDDDKGEARLNRFNLEQRPTLVWTMLTDLYKAGGERRSAGRMLTFLEANLSHRMAIEWAAEMKTLIGDGADGTMARNEPSAENDPAPSGNGVGGPVTAPEPAMEPEPVPMLPAPSVPSPVGVLPAPAPAPEAPAAVIGEPARPAAPQVTPAPVPPGSGGLDPFEALEPNPR